MKAITKLTAAALGAMSIAGGVALAQTTAPSKDPYASPDTANYGTPPGAPLKRDGSLRADPNVAPAANSTTDSSSNAMSSDSSSSAAAPAADTGSDASLQPRADRN